MPLSAGNHLAAGSCLALRKNVTSVTQPFSRLDRLSRIRMAFCPPQPLGDPEAPEPLPFPCPATALELWRRGVLARECPERLRSHPSNLI